MMNIDRARKLTATIRQGVEAIGAALGEAYHGQVWKPLGYSSWDAYCDGELGVRLALPSAQRREIVGDLSREGMSSRAIGSALGVSHPTVLDDRARGQDLPRADVVGLDGKRYPPSRPAPVLVPDPAETERLRIFRRLTIFDNHTSNLLDAMRAAVQIRGLGETFGDDDLGVGSLRQHGITRLREIAAAATELADYLEKKLRSAAP